MTGGRLVILGACLSLDAGRSFVFASGDWMDPFSAGVVLSCPEFVSSVGMVGNSSDVTCSPEHHCDATLYFGPARLLRAVVIRDRLFRSCLLVWSQAWCDGVSYLIRSGGWWLVQVGTDLLDLPLDDRLTALGLAIIVG